MVLTAVNQPAESAGLTRGMRLADARAAVPGVSVSESDPAADREALIRLGLWCRRFSPTVALDGADGLLLDVTGCSHLFGGEQAMVRTISERLAGFGLEARLGLADTPGSAGALARFTSRPWRVIASGNVRAALDPLPVEALGISCGDAQTLRNLGLTTVGAVDRLPRTDLERRFPSREGANGLLQSLDRVLGNRSDPLSPLVPPPAYRQHLDFAEPVLHREALETALAELMGRLTAILQRDRSGARQFALWCFGVDGNATERTAAAARPTRNAKHLLHLFTDALGTVDPGFGIDAVALHATSAEPMEGRQLSIDGHARDRLDRFIDRLAARFGAATILRTVPVERHVPEQAERLVRPGEAAAFGSSYPDRPQRPFRLLAPPEALETRDLEPDVAPRVFIWRHVCYRIVRAAGPERIAPEWWLPETFGTTRDYWRVEDTNGHRYWLYRTGVHGEGTPCWFLHGLYG